MRENVKKKKRSPLAPTASSSSVRTKREGWSPRPDGEGQGQASLKVVPTHKLICPQSRDQIPPNGPRAVHLDAFGHALASTTLHGVPNGPSIVGFDKTGKGSLYSISPWTGKAIDVTLRRLGEESMRDFERHKSQGGRGLSTERDTPSHSHRHLH
ncbi:hypothetical protein PM082_007518 [Marasmius tenuissimus]|nr:hypothetical protein PM082_007518 [Marasmius tenuissimus]